MHAKALLCDAQQHFTFEEVVLPDVGADRLRIRALKTGVSIGTEFALIRNKISWGPYPLCVGYQGMGVVEEIGDEVEDFEVGDKVYYRGGTGLERTDGTKISCVSGTHCSHAVIQPKGTHGVAKLPEGVNEEQASLFVMPSVALFGVNMANVEMGSVAVVFGCGQIGLGAVAFCARRGAVTVAVDIENRRLDIARQLGADYTFNGAECDALGEFKKLFPAGADTVFEASGIPACIDMAIPFAKSLGKFVMQGNYGADPISFHFLPTHGKRLTWFFPCDDGHAPCRRAVMKNLQLGALDWAPVITHRVKATDCAVFYDQLNHGLDKEVVGAVIDWE
ncbi:MAG: zinc-binding dehydrogenase [Lentisphaeria bacterium]|nr:zinc-binding dehydrogenase [Lentisphaeria bacterium]